MSDKSSFEVVIIGGGIAGASVAYFLADRGITDLVILERESQPGYHSTGRSAATLVEFDPNPTVQRLKAIGGSFLRNPPAGFAENPLVQHSQVMFVFRDSMLHELRGAIARLGNDGVSFEVLSQAQAVARVPALELDESDRAILLTNDGRIDVHELLSSYLCHPRRRGAQLCTNCEVRGVELIQLAIVRGFFWLAGQQGFGIESSPALGQIAADLIARGSTGIFDSRALSPARFSTL
jgi:D-arginine dehydrogenase